MTVKAEGWAGPTCTTATEPYRKALGVQTAELPTEEFYAQQTIPQTQQVNQ